MKIENPQVYCPHCNNWVFESDIEYWDSAFNGELRWGGCPYCGMKVYYSMILEGRE